MGDPNYSSCALNNSVDFVSSISVSYDPFCDKTKDLGYASSEGLDQSWLPHSLIRVFTVWMKKAKALGYSLKVEYLHLPMSSLQ